MKLYHMVSAIKLFLWLGLLVIDYSFIHVYEDPAIAIGLGFLWLFIACWGGSFFLFLWIQRVVRKVSSDRILKDSYKLSLLFWVYTMINVLLILLSYWTKLLGVWLLLVFIGLQIVLFSNNREIER